jgi:hypothetical protein
MDRLGSLPVSEGETIVFVCLSGARSGMAAMECGRGLSGGRDGRTVPEGRPLSAAGACGPGPVATIAARGRGGRGPGSASSPHAREHSVATSNCMGERQSRRGSSERLAVASTRGCRISRSHWRGPQRDRGRDVDRPRPTSNQTSAAPGRWRNAQRAAVLGDLCDSLTRRRQPRGSVRIAPNVQTLPKQCIGCHERALAGSGQVGGRR